jgi:hypothetical protein
MTSYGRRAQMTAIVLTKCFVPSREADGPSLEKGKV